MGQPTIYEPSVYNGNGIYKNGAGGGGGGFQTPYYNNFIQSSGTPPRIVFDEAMSNEDICIKINFVKINTNASYVMELLTENDTRVSLVYAATSLYVGNHPTNSDNSAWDISRNPMVVTIRNSSYLLQYGWNSSTYGCPYQQGNFKKVALTYEVIYQKICMYKASNLTNPPQEILHNLIPYYESNSDKGFIDTITNTKYPMLSNTKVY